MSGFVIVDRECQGRSSVLRTADDEDTAYAMAALFWRRGVRAASFARPRRSDGAA